jgi:hypothetical protein
LTRADSRSSFFSAYQQELWMRAIQRPADRPVPRRFDRFALAQRQRTPILGCFSQFSTLQRKSVCVVLLTASCATKILTLPSMGLTLLRRSELRPPRLRCCSDPRYARWRNAPSFGGDWHDLLLTLNFRPPCALCGCNLPTGLCRHPSGFTLRGTRLTACLRPPRLLRETNPSTGAG